MKESFLASLYKQPTAWWCVQVLFICVGVYYHEPWFDELQAWQLVQHTSLVELLAQCSFEHHPPLWYLVLYVLSFVGDDFVLVQLVHIGVAAWVHYLILVKSPFHWIERCLLASGYFFLYEYAVISRSYSISVLLILIYLYNISLQSKWLTLLVFGLLPWSTQQGALFSILLWLLTWWNQRGTVSEFLFKFRIPLLIWFIACVSAGILIIPNEQAAFFQMDHLRISWNFSLLLASISTFTSAMLPLPDFSQEAMWNTNFLNEYDRGMSVTWVVLGMMGILLWQLRRQYRIGIWWLLATLILLIYTYTVHFGFLRHHGFLWLAFIVFAWTSYSQWQSQWQKGIWWFLLLIHAVSGWLMLIADIRRPFSQLKDIATDFPKALFLTETDCCGLVVSYYSKEEVFSIVDQQFRFYASFKRGLNLNTPEEVAKEIRFFQTKHSASVYLISIVPYSSSEFHLIKEYKQSLNSLDHLYVYSILPHGN